MNNVGSIIYEKNFQTGELKAQWNYNINDQVLSGTGIAKGISGNQFAGDYVITYYTNGLEETASYKLVISEKEGQILLQWYDNEVLAYCGIGIIKYNFLIAGWSQHIDENVANQTIKG